MSEAVAGVESERLSWGEICRRFEGEWVLLIDVDRIDDDTFEGRSAVVVAHSKDRKVTLARAKELPVPFDFTHFFVDEFDVLEADGG